MAKSKYRAELNGDAVWTGTGDGSVKDFPEEYRRPEQGRRVHLFINDELVAVQEASE